jgi:hypothetical protein
MLKAAMVSGMRFGREKSKVRQFNNICTNWTDDCSNANARRMHTVLSGNFEGKHAHWSKNLERELSAFWRRTREKTRRLGAVKMR